ncbi:FecR family protein [Mucilaginibacter lappiensis]|uniref:Ferric-dicitrate binding protein FerR (Iron transport regulator) n=1 Tax=Mucilaginibacter lappiensis TaxID=354630 RepID=A0ABR6PVS7_9SPHI|nr:FecR domain-containing protein [Mucilaginibacter lappiensis]MBB6112426.1 ferric-dicitrate binding protein FerR (iron transport regulator) [Mucilaginibacter lappiensis]SIS00584.1 FecR family protein [Mucilaginibacter lappiensis]
MDSNSFNPEELGHKWLTDTLTPDEKLRFEQWYADFNDEELLISDSQYFSAEQIKESILNQINSKIDENQAPKVKIYKLWRNLAAAAAVVLAVGAAVLYRAPILNLVDPVKQLTLTTNPGEYRQIYLPDGTHIWLSPATTLSYPEKFRGTLRNVDIEGEAYFEVKHDTDHPFVIQSGAVKTVVLGTSFDIQAYAHAKSIDVTVVSGKVGVSAKTGTTTEMLTANQRTVYQKTTASLIKENYPNAAKFLDRRKGIFDFNGASLAEVIHDLEVQYGTHITLSPGLTSKTFYGRLQTTNPINHTLDKLGKVMELRWEKQNGTYLLHP